MARGFAAEAPSWCGARRPGTAGARCPLPSGHSGDHQDAAGRYPDSLLDPERRALARMRAEMFGEPSAVIVPQSGGIQRTTSTGNVLRLIGGAS